MRDLTLSPWWFLIMLTAFGGVGYFAGGRLGTVEGIAIVVALAHGALLEALRDRLTEIDDLRAKLSALEGNSGVLSD